MKQSTGTAHNGPALYSLIHKGIRDQLFKFSASAGRVNYAEDLQVSEFQNSLTSLVDSIRLHHHLEEQFIHPVISDRLPGGALKLEEEHKVVDQQLNDLVGYLDGIRIKTAGFERYQDLGLEFYLSFNRFLSFFLMHMNDEEERIQRTLFDLCTVPELVSTFGRILASQTMDQVEANTGMVIAGANLDDLTGLLMGAKVLMPPEEYKKVLKMAESTLKPADWSALKIRVGIT
jgi:hypothetical protein